jgi:ATP-binding protein involved in chromosome partitioning
MTKEQVLKALGHVQDPDLKKDLVTLNMIQDLKIDGQRMKFSLVLTTPACPLKDFLKKQCKDAILKYANPNAEVEIELSSQVTTVRKQTDELLKNVKNIIAVGSGKGGVGKSTVAVNLAVALAKTGAKVGLLDADIYGPSIPMMFGLKDDRPHIIDKEGKSWIVPIQKLGLKILSIGFFIDQSKALIWRGPMISTALKQLISDAIWDELDYMVIDLPPGTGDIPLTLIQNFPLTGAIIVSTPQDMAIADVRKAADMFSADTIHIPILGLVENMSYFIPPDMPDKKYYVFGKSGCAELAKELSIPLLVQIPIVTTISDAGDQGRPVATIEGTPVTVAFTQLAESVAQQVAIHNAIKESAGNKMTNK